MLRRHATPRRSILRLALVGATSGVLAACSGEESSPEGTRGTAGEAADMTSSPGYAGQTVTPEPGDDDAAIDSEASTSTGSAAPRTIVASSVVNKLKIYPAPKDPDQIGSLGTPEQVLNRADRITGQLVLLALEVGDAWTKVQLPVRPNGSTGWVRSSEISLTGHDFSITVDLTKHEIVVTNGDREVTRSPVGVGRADRPTPGGEYFITELLQPPEPDGIYGPYAYGLSGYSDVLMDFAGGEGVIGIHGTNEPEAVGTDVSSGCIRLPNPEIIRLVERVGVPLGTPVTIRA